MKIKTMLTATALLLSTVVPNAVASDIPSDFIGKQKPHTTDDKLTPELLWAMGRIGGFQSSPDGKTAVYSVSYYSVKQNKSHTVLYSLNLLDKTPQLLTQSNSSESSAVYIKDGRKIAFLSSESGSSQVWEMNPDGTGRKQLSSETKDVADFLFSPDGKKVILIMDTENTSSIQKNDKDLDKASGMVINDLMYKHWDQYTTTAPHPFVADFNGESIKNCVDLLEGEPYECPMLPFGGIEQLAWSPDSKTIAYTCRKKTGLDYAISTDSDIFLYDIESKKTVNICKPKGYETSNIDPTVSLKNQSVNAQDQDINAGYDQNPQFSPDGKYIAWLSMERDGYESDRTRLCVYELSSGKKNYVTESFESGVNEFCWGKDSETLYFTGVWHATTQIYQTNIKGNVKKLTDDVCDYTLLGLSADGKGLIAKRHSMSQADEIYHIQLKKNKYQIDQLTFENKDFYDQITMGEVKERWVKTVDGKQELCWVIYPPHFDPSRKYPTLLFCEGGPQSPVSQFWSYRWNFQVMAAQGYIIIAPNRRGLPGFGMEWLEEISGDYSGLCMQDYLSAIDDICKEAYVDKEHLGAVGASFGGYSVYWLAGNHNKRFKAFIAHDGIYNTQQQYVETEELWFPNWDMGKAPWYKDEQGKMQKVFETSPHLYVDKWDTPILCIHGQKDFRIEYTQAESAFTAARLRGIPAQLLLFPDENHWVLKPQNGILWQRTFFRWLDRWLKTNENSENKNN
ncbi:MAG TPA: S9 family peptidase [Alloprevotella sp.]|nr:S9 family peptidase [Alloprevotella sp.]